MRYLFVALFIGGSVTAASAQNYGMGSNPSDHYVQGHTTSSGTYVAPHYQTNPNGNPSDNYGAQGNSTPTTGRQAEATEEPYGRRVVRTARLLGHDRTLRKRRQMNLQNWVSEARAHWKEFLPSLYKEFDDAGVLDEALRRRRSRRRGTWRISERGADWDQAWERTRGEYLFLPEEDEQKAKADREPAASEAARLFNEIARLQSEILQMGNDEE